MPPLAIAIKSVSQLRPSPRPPRIGAHLVQAAFSKIDRADQAARWIVDAGAVHSGNNASVPFLADSPSMPTVSTTSPGPSRFVLPGPHESLVVDVVRKGYGQDLTPHRSLPTAVY